MKKVVYSQVLAENGITNFSGLYDKNGLPVNVELEVKATLFETMELSQKSTMITMFRCWICVIPHVPMKIIFCTL